MGAWIAIGLFSTLMGMIGYSQWQYNKSLERKRQELVQKYKEHRLELLKKAAEEELNRSSAVVQLPKR